MRFLRRGAASLGCLLAATTISVPAAAVFPDNPTTEFKAVGMIGNYVGGNFKMNGCGVAIAPNWVIGVAHVGGNTFEQDGKFYPIAKKIIYKSSDGKEPADLAVYRLAIPCTYRADLQTKLDEQGKASRTVTIVGFGETGAKRQDGSGWRITQGSEGTRRLTTETIDYYGWDRYNIGSNDDPKWKNSLSIAYHLRPGSQGGIAGKDSGCGWFFNDAGHQVLIAVAASVGHPESTKDNYRYGAVGFGIALQPYLAWIRQQTKIPAISH